MKLALLIALLLIPGALAATFDLSVSVENPRITITYTKPVHLQETTLYNVDPAAFAEYELVQVAPPEGQAYAEEYILVVRQGGSEVALPPGDYQMILSAADTQGVSSNDVVNIHITGLDIALIDPPFGVASVHPYDVFFTTRLDDDVVEASCGYSRTNPPGTLTPVSWFEDGYTIEDLDYQGYLTISCTYEDRAATETFQVSWDATPPAITAHASPATVTNPNDKSTVLTIQTNEPTVCTVDGRPFGGNPEWYASYVNVHENRTYYASVTDTEEHIFTHEISCVNLAGLVTHTTLNVTVNLGLAQNIEVLSPGQYVNSSSFTLVVRPSKPADTCTVGSTPMQKTDDTFRLPFTGVAQGLQQFTITCVGAETATRQYNVTVDTTPPTLTVNASSLLCMGNVSASWNATDNTMVLGYTYTVEDAQGLIAQGETIKSKASVLLGRPLSGTLTWKVTARDRAGNARTVAVNVPALHEGEDEECGLPPFIRLTAPALGFAPSAPYTVRLETKRPAECRYSLQQGVAWSARVPFSTADGIHHNKSFSFTDQDLHVWCAEPDGRNHTKVFHVGVDTTPPVVSVSAEPNPVVDPAHKVVVMTVTTSDPTFCTYNNQSFDGAITDPSTFTDEHVATLDFRDITSTDPIDRNYQIACTNLANLNKTVAYTVHIDLSTGLKITRVSPDEFTSATAITLAVLPNLEASCAWKPKNATQYSAFSDVDENVHSVGLGNLGEGTYQYDVQCTGIATQGTTVVGFTVYRTPPGIEDITGPSALCPSSTGKYAFTITGVDKHPVIGYDLVGPSAASFERNTTGATIAINTKGFEPGDYTLSLTPIGRTGLVGDTETYEILVLASSDPACSLNATSACKNGIKDAGEKGVDCGGVCTATCNTCAVDTECDITMSCTAGLCVTLPPAWSPPPTTTGDTPVDEPPLGSDPTAECTSDYQCNIDQVCTGGACVKSRTTPTATPIDVQQPTDTGGADWLALTFIILGVILMGGSGWYLYQQHTPNAFSPSMPPPAQPSAPRAPPVQPGAPDAQAAERERLLERIRAEKAKKAGQRHAVFDNFEKDGKKPKKGDGVFDELEKL